MPSAPAANRSFSTLSCEFFLGCLSPYPGGFAECICLVLPQRRRPSPNEKWGRLPASVPWTRLFTDPYFVASAISLGSGLRVLLASPVVPSAASSLAGQPRLLPPSRTCVVTFARIGYIIGPTTDWPSEDFHLARFTALSTASLTAGVDNLELCFRLRSRRHQVGTRCVARKFVSNLADSHGRLGEFSNARSTPSHNPQ